VIYTGSEFVLSTHENGRPKVRTILTTLIYYVIIGVVLLISGFYTYYRFYVEKFDVYLGVFKFIPFMLLIFGFIAIILGIRNVQIHETIKVDRYGITINQGNKSKTASWNEINKIKNTMTFVPRYSSGSFVELIVIKSVYWRHKIKRGNFSVNDLKRLFFIIAEQAKTTSVTVVDELDWLPKQFKFHKSIAAEISYKMREYRILFKVGLVMLILGFLIFIPVIILNSFNSNLFIICSLLLFFGLMLTLVGLFGISEEKKKMKK
jgi:hypothetical protein